MSWKGFTKAVSRATTSVMQSTGAIDKTVDREFEEEERRYRSLENKVEKLHKEAKGYLDAVRAMTLAQQRIAETVNNFYEDGAPLGYAGMQYKTAVEQMDEEARTELDTNYRTTVLDPLGKFIAVFPDFNEAIKRRQKKLLDYDRLRSQARKLVEKPSDDPGKLPRAESEANAAREVYESLNRQLVTEIPKLVDLRVPYIDPSFEALVKSQLVFNEAAFYKLDAIKTAFPGNGGLEHGIDRQVEDVLQQMRDLTICGSGN
ncbi:hypothetical protein BDK51DRAFT_28484 [Blyttiomyces helicus]|uniref:BAR domain-containing protein n=1 Tax=Blyttiomyces helicus TaxID=388810 RepID=A0A4P9VZJ7_9FUNG|nr:hypothetical protein BDK51DRAFT_28484 [Blyttiomyces helicus]|eukprot:RKO83798.1 hypothetical protein BDK51DRAFT_28484 [Blyttiomyces helicus]